MLLPSLALTNFGNRNAIFEEKLVNFIFLDFETFTNISNKIVIRTCMEFTVTLLFYLVKSTAHEKELLANEKKVKHVN